MSGAATVQFTVSPDFGPDRIAGWYVFNTWLQKASGQRVHLELYPDFASQREALRAGGIDVIYANPYDAAELVRERGFAAVAKAHGRSDEVVVAVAAGSAYEAVEDLRGPTRVVTTDDPDVRLIGMILLEVADLAPGDVEAQEVDTYVLVAKALLDGRADVGIFYREAFDNLSGLVRHQLRPLVASEISVVHHALMVGPRVAAWRQPLTDLLTHMGDEADGRAVLEALGIDAWEPVDDEQAEFMIDLMATLA